MADFHLDMQVKKEADWTKNIPSESVTFYFYVMFFIAAAFAGIAVLMDVYLMTKKFKLGLYLLLRSAPALILACVNALFLYIVSARALLK